VDLPPNKTAKLEAAAATAVASLELPSSVLMANWTIDPYGQKRLYDRIVEKMRLDEMEELIKGLKFWINITGASGGTEFQTRLFFAGDGTTKTGDPAVGPTSAYLAHVAIVPFGAGVIERRGSSFQVQFFLKP
jgi:hypothetical protein